MGVEREDREEGSGEGGSGELGEQEETAQGTGGGSSQQFDASPVDWYYATMLEVLPDLIDERIAELTDD